jgi:DNA-binding NarL/FixJ family response regulator
MLKVLVSDDHQLFREGLAQVVSRLGHEVEITPAGTYPETVTAIASGPRFDLILVERSLLPTADGGGITDVVRRAGGTPVVVVSAVNSHGDIAQARTAGASGFLLKSSPVSVMQDALRTVLDGGTTFPADGPGPVNSAEVSAPRDGAPSDTDRTRVELLTHRQRDVLALVGEGRSNKDIAEALGISEGTVKVHVGAILKALGTANRTQAALIAIDCGIAALPHDTSRARRA